MRRFASIIILALITSIALGLNSATVAGQFATNTPIGSEGAASTNTASPVPTDAPQGSGGFNFATNTPSGPTSTPSPSPSPSATATETSTNTPTPTASPTETNTPTPTVTPIGPSSYPEGVNPLTGLLYPDEEATARRNLIVKISNYPPIVRPQTGVNKADVVFEYEAEGGVTRFAAIYRSQSPGLVGSIRSARLLDMELVPMYQGLLAYSGTSEPIQRLLLASDFRFQLISPLIGDNCEDAGFCRDEALRDAGVAFEHTLFGNTDLMWQVGTRRNVNTGFRARGFAFNETADENGAQAEDVFIDWYGQTDARWQWDAEAERYIRYTEGVAHFDKGDDEQLWADNLIILEVPHERRPDLFEPGVNYESIEIQLWDQGRAFLLRDGVSYQGFWRRQNREPGSALQIIYGNNVPIMMKPGRTWVSVVRGFGDVIISPERQEIPAPPTATPTPESVG